MFSAYLLPAFGDRELESIRPADIERWRRSLTSLSNRSKNKLLIQLHGIFRRAQIVWGIPANPLARVEKHPVRSSGDIQVFSPEAVWALVRAAALATLGRRVNWVGEDDLVFAGDTRAHACRRSRRHRLR